MTLLEMRDAVRDELDDELLALIGATAAEQNAVIDRWINQGRRRLDFYPSLTASLTWSSGDLSVPLPAAIYEEGELRLGDGVSIDDYFVHGATLYFRDADGARMDGTATIFYRAIPATLEADDDASELPSLADDAAIFYALYRFFVRIARSRALYTRYATVSGANAVDIAELEAIAQDHKDEFEAARDQLPPPASVTFFGE